MAFNKTFFYVSGFYLRKARSLDQRTAVRVQRPDDDVAGFCQTLLPPLQSREGVEDAPRHAARRRLQGKQVSFQPKEFLVFNSQPRVRTRGQTRVLVNVNHIFE